MAYRFLALALVLWAVPARGSSERDVTASCCGYYEEQKWDEYSKCVNSHGVVPVCDGSRRGCYYGNRFYTEGEVVAAIPKKCLKLVCSQVIVHNHDWSGGNTDSRDGGQLVADNSRTVQMQVVHVSQGCGCCEHEGQLYPNRTARNLDRSKCEISICIDGHWTHDDHDDYTTTDYYWTTYYRMDDSGRGEEMLRNGYNDCLGDCDDDYYKCKYECRGSSSSESSSIEDDDCLDKCGEDKETCYEECPGEDSDEGDKKRSENFEAKSDDDSCEDCEELLDCLDDCDDDDDYVQCANSCCEEHPNCSRECTDECFKLCGDDADCFRKCINDGDSDGEGDRKRYWYPTSSHLYNRKCCYYNGQYYIEGETIALHNESHGRNCRRIYCAHGHIRTSYMSCCCIEDNEMYSCYGHIPLPSSDHETCSIRKCCDGFIETHHEPGCCLVNDHVYKPGQVVGYTPDYCQCKRCVGGEVVLEDTGSCCKYDGKYYRYGEAVESNPSKCILKICHWRGNIVDYSVDDCPCCIYNDRLHLNGSIIHPSSCVALVCIDGKWVDNCYRIKCDYCHVGVSYKTFDGVVYNYNGHCNSTLVQIHNSYYYNPSRGIYLSFKRCSVPFSDALACNDVLTIKHSYNTAVTIHPGGRIQVNGDQVTELPYYKDYGLFIYETAYAIRVVTFYDLVVEYGKDFNPDVRIFTPSHNKWCLYGLCGAYDGRQHYDLRPRYRYGYSYSTSLSYFYNSWKTARYSCSNEDGGHGRNCSSLTAAELSDITKWCDGFHDSFKCHQGRLNVTTYQEACVRYMCACLPCMESECENYIITDYFRDCTALGGHVYSECAHDHETHPSTETTETTSSASSTSYWYDDDTTY